MKATLALLLGLALTLILPADPAAAGPWYSGGTLHKALARQWHAATEQNRLATSADFVAAGAKVRSMDDLKVRAYALSRCITAATDDPRLYSLQVSEVAALCLVQLGYKR